MADCYRPRYQGGQLPAASFSSSSARPQQWARSSSNSFSRPSSSSTSSSSSSSSSWRPQNGQPPRRWNEPAARPRYGRSSSPRGSRGDHWRASDRPSGQQSQSRLFSPAGKRTETSPPATDILAGDKVVGLLVNMPRNPVRADYIGRPRTGRSNPWGHPAIITKVCKETGLVNVVCITSFQKQPFVVKWRKCEDRLRYFPFADETAQMPEVNPDRKHSLAFAAAEGQEHPLTWGSYVNGDDCWSLDGANVRPYRKDALHVLDEASLAELEAWRGQF